MRNLVLILFAFVFNSQIAQADYYDELKLKFDAANSPIDAGSFPLFLNFDTSGLQCVRIAKDGKLDKTKVGFKTVDEASGGPLLPIKRKYLVTGYSANFIDVTKPQDSASMTVTPTSITTNGKIKESADNWTYYFYKSEVVFRADAQYVFFRETVSLNQVSNNVTHEGSPSISYGYCWR